MKRATAGKLIVVSALGFTLAGGLAAQQPAATAAQPNAPAQSNAPAQPNAPIAGKVTLGVAVAEEAVIGVSVLDRECERWSGC